MTLFDGYFTTIKDRYVHPLCRLIRHFVVHRSFVGVVVRCCSVCKLFLAMRKREKKNARMKLMKGAILCMTLK